MRAKRFYILVFVLFYGIFVAGAYGADADFNVVMGPAVDDRADSHVLTIGEAVITLEADAIPIPDTWVYTKKDNSMIEDQSLYTKTGGVFVTKNTDTNAHAHIRGLELESFEYSGKMMVTSTGGIGITFLSDFPNTDSYYRIRGYVGQTMHLAPHPQVAVDKGELTFQGVIDSGFKPKAGTWILFKIRVVVEPAGTRIQAMLWNDGRLQPPVWQIDAIDTSARRYTKGTIGLWSGGPGEKNWSDLRLKRLEYVSEAEVVGVNSFLFARDLQPGTYQVTALSAADYQTLISKPSTPFEWVLEEPEPEEILIEVTKPTVIRIIVK